jgi:diguanylate cyclase (GGDEF)-like protein
MHKLRRDIGLVFAVCALGFFVAAGVYRFLARSPETVGPAATAALLVVLAFSVPLAAFYLRTKDKEKAEGDLRLQNRRLNAVLANMPLGISMYDADRRLVVSNDRFRSMYAVPAELWRSGTSVEDIETHLVGSGVGPVERLAEGGHTRSSASTPSTMVTELADGRVLAITRQPIQGGGWLAVHNDISELRRIEAQLAYMARHDSLTGLPNRAQFDQRVAAAFESFHPDERFAVLCLDLDQFKHINDSLGHSAGDDLLCGVAKRLATCLGEGDMLARLNGDEFAILQMSADQPKRAAALAERLGAALRQPFDLHGHELAVDGTFGIAIAPADGANASLLLKNADLALHRAKSDGRGRCRFFEPGMDRRMHERRKLETELRLAIRDGAFELFYQPLVNARSQEIAGVEALIRWRHPDRGLVSPAEFIPLAEETGLIVPLGEWVIRRACADAAAWPENVVVSVNLAAAQFETGNLVPVVVSAVSASGLSTSRLILEITETALLRDTKMTIETLHMLRSLGVRIAMDDFGTGYSSLSYLRSFPFDKIKIDRSFVKDLPNDADARAIVRAVANLGASLGIELTAEGVETAEQLASVRSEGYTEIQGNYFSEPAPAGEIAKLFVQTSRAAAAG